jgi:tRNA nucleotidyltransferase (CCA-adding enzyme)
MRIPTIIQIISKTLQEHHAKAIIVGGAVRDYLLKLPIKDYDIEVYGLDRLEQLEQILALYGEVNFVGKSFGVLKFVYEGEEYDFSFPRTEQKVGRGHRGFDVICDGSLSFEDAAKRRDFTINAMGYDPTQKILLDPYGGVEDISLRRLCHIDDQTFVEDPLRLYRAVQFAARFEFDLAEETVSLSRKMIEQGALDELPKERIYQEFKKLLLRSSKPSLGFEWMRKLGILRYYPELEAIIDVPQSAKWHPEGDVWRHTMMALDKMVAFQKGDERYDLRMMFATLCHDFGKATHTQINDNGSITAIGHEKAGVLPTEHFLYRLMDEHAFIQSILPLVAYHLAPSSYYRNGAKDSTIRKLATKVNIEELVTVARADFLGRTTSASLAGVYHAGDWLLSKAKALNVAQEPIKPLLQGRDLIEIGLKPSKRFKELLDRLYLAQLNGKIGTKKEALTYLKELIGLS